MKTPNSHRTIGRNSGVREVSGQQTYFKRRRDDSGAENGEKPNTDRRDRNSRMGARLPALRLERRPHPSHYVLKNIRKLRTEGRNWERRSICNCVAGIRVEPVANLISESKPPLARRKKGPGASGDPVTNGTASGG